MKVLVCVKQVPDTNTKVTIKADKSAIDTNGVKWVMNPYDELAVEQAIQLKEKGSAQSVTVVSVGPKSRVIECLRTALAMGADDAIVVDAPEYLDNFTTASALAKISEKEGPFSLIFAGKLAIDDQQSATPQMIASLTGMACATVVSKFDFNDSVSSVEREIEGGAREKIELKGPAVIGANKGLNTPRYASLPGIMKAKKKPVKEYDLTALEISVSATVKYQNFQLPPDRPQVKMLGGDSGEQVSALVKLLREESKVI